MSKNNVGYVDGFVLVISKKRLAEYRKMARGAAKIWMKYGALGYKECVLDDAKPQWVKLTFPKLAKVRKGETVWFSYIEYKSKAHRDQVNTKVMKDPAMHMDENAMANMPFDMKRMSYGGFKVIVSD